MSAHDAVAPVISEAQTTTSPRKDSTGGDAAKSPANNLRGLTYAEGEHALTPPPEAGGDIQLKEDTEPALETTPIEPPTSAEVRETSDAASSESTSETSGETSSTSETSASSSAVTNESGGTAEVVTNSDGPGDNNPDPRANQTEEQAVAETHGLTLAALEEKILQLSGSTKKVFKFRKQAKAADFAKEIFYFLKGYDSTTITAAWNNVKGECAGPFADLIKAIGYKDSARKYPRESRATLAAHDDLAGFAAGCAKQNPYAAMLAAALMPEAARASFMAAHPAIDKDFSAADRESLGTDAFFGKEQALRKDEEAYRNKMTASLDTETKIDESATKAASSESGKQLSADVQAALSAGKNVAALTLIGTHASEDEARAAVRQMDATGQVTALLQALSFDEKWNTYPHLVQRLLAYRSADRNLADAQVLFPVFKRKTNDKGRVKHGTTRKSKLTSEEAYAIFQFMKALPAPHRQQFQDSYPALWAEMNMHLNGSMKDADDTNFVGANGGDQETIARLLVQLDDTKFWFESVPGKMSATLNMIITAGHRREIGAKLNEMAQGADLGRLYQDAARRGAIESSLGMSGDASQIPADGAPEDQAAAWLGCLKLEQTITQEDDKPKMRVFKALGALTHANKETRKEIREEKKEWKEAKKNGEDVGEAPDREKPNLLKQAFGRDGVKVENVAVDELEDMTTSKNGNEDFFGLDFADIDRKGGDEDQKDRNRVDAEFNPYDGKLLFKAPSLELEAVRFPAGDLLIQTGPVLLKDLQLDVRWPTATNRAQKQRVFAEASIIDARDIMISGPGVMASVAHLGAQKINFLLSEQDVDYSDNPEASQILRIVSEQNPARSLIAAFVSGRIDGASAELVEYLAGFPGGAQGGLELNVGSVVAEGIQVGANTYIDKAGVTGISLTYDTRPSVHFEARAQQLTGMIDDARAQLATMPDGQLSETDAHKKTRLAADIARWGDEQATLNADIPKWKEKEQLYQEIFELNRLLGVDAQKGASDARTTALKARAQSLGYVVPDGAALGDVLSIVHKDLAHHAGATASIDNVNVKGVELDGAKVDEVNVNNVDVSGEGDALASALDMKTIKRLGGDGSQNNAGSYVSSEVSADVGNLDIKGVSVSGGAPMATVLCKTRDRYHALQAMAERQGADLAQFQALDAQWKVVLADGRSYGEVAEGMASLWDLHGAKLQQDPTLLAQFKGYERALSGHPITVEAISIAGVSIQSGTGEAEAVTLDNKPVNVSNAHSRVSVGEVEASNIGAGQTQVGSVTATGISADANVDLLSNPQGLLKPDALDANATIASVHANDVTSGGTTINEVGAQGINLQVQSGPDGSAVALDIDKVYTKGFGLEAGKKTAEDKLVSLQAEIDRRKEKGEAYADLEAQKQAISDGLATYTQAYSDQTIILAEIKTIDAKIESAHKSLDAAKREAKVVKHKNTKDAEAGDAATIKGIQAQIDALSLERKGAKDRLAAPQKIIASYEGTLGLGGEASLDNIHVKAEGLPKLAEVMKLANGDPTADLSGTYQLDLGLGPLTIPAIDYASPQMRIALAGAMMPSLAAKASVAVEKVEPTADKPAGHRIKGIEIAKLAIPELSGSGLDMVFGVEGEQIHLELPTVSLKGLSLDDVKLAGLDAAALTSATGEFKLAEVSASMSAKVGDALTANGSLSLKGLHAEALSSGAVNFGLGDLTLDKLGFKQTETQGTKGGGSIVTQIISIGGKATKLGKLTVDGSYDRNTSELSTTVGLGDLVLSGVNYAGGGTRLGVGYAAMKGVKATVGAKFKQGKVPEGESPLDGLWLTQLHIDALAGKNIDYNGRGQKRERFGDGTEKVTAIEQHIGLTAGTLYGIDVGRMRLDDDPAFKMTLKSANVTGLDLWMKQNGQQVLSAKASAAVSGVSVSMVDDDLSVGIKNFSGSAGVKVGLGDNQTSLDVKNVNVSGTQVNVNDMGSADQTTSASVDSLTAKQIDFGMGVKGSGMNTAHGLGGAQLNGITFKSDNAKTSVDIASGSGALLANSKMTGVNSGNYDANDPTAQQKDEFVAPMYKVQYDISALDKLNGRVKLLYPDGLTFLHLDVINGALKLDVTDNIKQIWGSWWQDIKGNGLSSWGLDMDAWGKRLQAISDIDDNAFYSVLLKGAEMAFNNWGESLTGGWSNLAKSIVGSLNADPKTSLVKAEPLAFASFQDSLNTAMHDYVDVGISKVLDYGMLYDLGKGEYGRAASDAGLWLVEWFGETVGWDAADQWAEEKRDAYRADREAELRKIVGTFVTYMTSGGVELGLGSKDGALTATKTPLSGGPTKPLLSSLVDIDVAGGGSLTGGINVTSLGKLRKFHYQDGGTSIDMSQLKFGASATGKGNVDFDEKTSRFAQADVDLEAGTFIEFEGLRFQIDKTFKDDALPAGVTKTSDQFDEHGNTTSGHGPVSDGKSVHYDAGQYSEMMQNGEDPVGPDYSTDLGLKDKLKAKGIGVVSDRWADDFKSKTIATQNAEVFGRYAPKGKAAK